MAESGFITITIDGAPAMRKIATFGMQVSDLTPAWQVIAADMRDDVLHQFESEGGLTNSAHWAELRPSTVADRIRNGYQGDHPILYRTGSLLMSFTAQGMPGHVEDIQPDHLTIGSNYWTAGWHQKGTGRMPARPMMGISGERRTGIVNRIREYVQELLVQGGLGA